MSSSRDVNTSFARTLVDEWARHGVTDACVAPGSRSAPLALALAAHSRIDVHVHLDERSASFFALGLAKATARPVIMLCTSGTAAANFHPAVLEAHHGRVPLIVCTADRPPELRDTGAPQTIDQVGLYGGALRWSCDAGVPSGYKGADAVWRSLASLAIAEASGPPPGPVHLNLPFREPLVPTGDRLLDTPGRAGGAPWTRHTPARRLPDAELVQRVAEVVHSNPRGLLLAGWGAAISPATADRFARAAGWPILADPLSNVRSGELAISTYEALSRTKDFADAAVPDVVLRVGAALTSRVTGQWLGSIDAHKLVVDPDAVAIDPARVAGERLLVDAEALLDAVANELGTPDDPAWLAGWLEAEAVARETIDELIDEWSDPFEGRVARDLVAMLPIGATLVVASSMPVRDVEAFALPRTGVRFVANRGVNGIDGFVSTALGYAVGDGPVVALLGDLCFLHDSNGLLGARERGLDAVFVVIDNDGGGIFSFLPQAELPDHFEQLFGTPHGLDLVEIAESYRVHTERVEKSEQLAPVVEAALEAGGVHVIVVTTHRAENVARHRAVWTAVERAITQG